MDTQLLLGDCLEWIPRLPKQSVDFIFCDPPFGAIKEGRLKAIDKMIAPDKMWAAFRHVLKPSGTVIVFGTQPYISLVICSNLKDFRYDLIWRKEKSGFLNCRNRPLREHYTIAVFSERAPVWNPLIKSRETAAKRDRSNGVYNGVPKPGHCGEFIRGSSISGNLYDPTNHPVKVEIRNVPAIPHEGAAVFNPQMLARSYPATIIELQATSKNLHPFEKSVAVCEWLIKTYTNEKMTVLDPTMGSGSSGIACRSLNRKFIGIEQDENWFLIARDRIYEHDQHIRSFV